MKGTGNRVPEARAGAGPPGRKRIRETTQVAEEIRFRLYMWPHKAVYLGARPGNEFHTHHAAQICASLNGTLIVEDETGTVESTCIVVAPDHRHRIAAAGTAPMVTVYLEPEGRECAFLMRSLFRADRSARTTTLDTSPRGQQDLRELYKSGREAHRAWSTCANALGLSAPESPPAERDSRVDRVIDMIRHDHGASCSLARLASAVHLSPSRLAHLFRSEIGVPVRRFVVWSRLRHVVRLAADGRTLTVAAHEAGFHDAAHMSTSFRRMFGFSPSALFGQRAARDIRLIDRIGDPRDDE